MPKKLDSRVRQVLARGTVIPAHPLALTAERRLDERRQRALTRYYVAAGAGALAGNRSFELVASVAKPRRPFGRRNCYWIWDTAQGC